MEVKRERIVVDQEKVVITLTGEEAWELERWLESAIPTPPKQCDAIVVTLYHKL